jgi:hypothetical protein
MAAVLAALAVAAAGAGATGPATPIWSSPRLVGTLSHGESTELATVDLNGDGLRDVIVGSTVWERRDPQSPIVLINKGGGRLVDETNALFGGKAPKVEWGREILTADFNRDGKPDIFIADHGYVNDSDPSFVRNGAQQHLILSTADGRLVDASDNLPQQLTFTHSAAVADVNGDGAPDIFENNVGCCSAGHVQAQILLNDGTGRFTVESDGIRGMIRDVYGNDHSYACALADVNGDGSPDLVVGGSEERGANASQVLLNDGHGRFTFFETLPATIGPPNNAFVIDMKAADINGDGAIDLVFGETLNDPWYIGTTIQVLLNDGHGGFADRTAVWMPKQPDTKSWADRLLTEDVNDDGRPDLTIQYASAGRSPTPVWRNAGTSFVPIPPPRDGDFSTSGLGPVGYINGAGSHALVSIDWADSSGGTPNVYVTRQLVVPAVPTGVQATTTTGIVRIAWSKADGAASYEVLRAAQRGGTFARLGATPSTSFVDRTAVRGRSYWYAVEARNAAGVSRPSSPVIGRRR